MCALSFSVPSERSIKFALMRIRQNKSHLLLVQKNKFLMTIDMLKQGSGQGRKEPLKNDLMFVRVRVLTLSMCADIGMDVNSFINCASYLLKIFSLNFYAVSFIYW